MRSIFRVGVNFRERTPTRISRSTKCVPPRKGEADDGEHCAVMPSHEELREFGFYL